MTTALTWLPVAAGPWQGLLVACSVVFGLILAVLLLVLWARPACRVRRAPAAAGPASRPARSLAAGLAVLPVLIVAGAFADSVSRRPAEQDKLHVEVIARQWSWSVRYLDGEAPAVAGMPNRIHVPVDRPVSIELRSADVFHSLWIPGLSAKAEIVPGRTAQLRFTATAPGVFQGRCDAACGPDAAQMTLSVVAEPGAEFDAWLRARRSSMSREVVPPAHAGLR